MNEGVKNLLNSLLSAIECEREEERRQHIEEIKILSPIEREQKGRALIDLKKKKPTMTLTGDYLYVFRKRDRSDLPDMEFSSGDQVVISQYDPLDAANPTGVVYEVGKKQISIQTSQSLNGGGGRPYRLDLFVNDLTFQRMQMALTQAKSPANSKMHKILGGEYAASTKPNDILEPRLNEKQLDGVRYAASCNGFYTIQGPPGTGKTYMAASLIENVLKSGKRILISADSNAAVDNLIKKCVDLGLEPLRIGHPIRVNDDLKKYTLDYRIVRHALFGEIYDIEKQIEHCKDDLRDLDKPKQKDLRGLSYEEVMRLIEKNQSTRGISKRTLRSMKPYVKTQMKIDKLFDKIREIKAEITSQLLAESMIIAATNSTCGSEVLENMHFDFSVVDEASQASIPSTLIATLKADRFILIGDHFQLPPVVISQEAVNLGLSRSLMDLMAELYPYQLCMLEVQYRMNAEISELVSDTFYSSKLIAHESVAKRKLKLSRALGVSAEPLEFINCEGRERRREGSKSYFNVEEANLCQKLVRNYLNAGLDASQISIISPYRAQVDCLRERISSVEIDTVDAFQGRENDLIILSSVRANDRGTLGFLKDRRRLNVSISRAKKKLVVVGSRVLLEQDSLYKELIYRMTGEHGLSRAGA